jgi:hypothetical protein
MDQAVSPQEHLRQAKAALDSIPAASVTGRHRTQLTELKRHVTALERASAGTSGSMPAATGEAKSTPGATSGRANTNWGTEVAAIDKTLTEMLGGAGTTGAPGATGATGTTGKTGTAGTTGTRSTDTMLDEATRAKLMEVRTHITAYAAAMSGGQSVPKRDESAATASPASPAESPAAPAAPSPSQEGSVAGAAAAPATESQAQTPGAADAAASQQVDPEAARRHLVAARDSLNQLTQLPAAAQLTGEARAQVTQLISNFNELITTQTDWRASYAKVDANMAALLGPDNTADALPPATSTSTPGAVGTSGTATMEIDPAVRAKLVEMRRNLNEFEKASGGAEKK